MARQRKRWILLSFGVLLLLVAVGGSFFWFYWLNPQRKYIGRCYVWNDPLWHHRKWADTQKRIRRFRWWHDDFGWVGSWGGKEWVEWITNHIKPGEKIFDCQHGHMDNALRMMTNQDPGFRAEDWLAWWQENQHKTQVEWIREGFQQAGITLHSPLSSEDVRALLALIGKRESPVAKEDQVTAPSWEFPWYLRYNAMRWLRDSDFDPRSLSVDDLTGQDGDVLLNALLLFCQWKGENGKGYTPGELPITGPVEEWKLSVPPIAGPWVAVIAYSSLAVVFAAGTLSLRFALRSR